MTVATIDWGFSWEESFRDVFRKRRKVCELSYCDGEPWRVSWWRGSELGRLKVEYRCRLANAK